MWTGYLALGGLEVANNARAIGYARSASCPIWWHQEDPCEGFLESVGLLDGYDVSQIEQAPWYDADLPEESSGFYGALIVTMDGLSDSTRTATIAQRLGPGGSISQVRDASRGVRVRVMLTAADDKSLEYGMTWLEAALTPGACGSHGTACGTTDLEFFDECPPSALPGESVEDYERRVDDRRRFLHSTKCVSGPLVQEEFESNLGSHVGRIVQFTIVAEVPYVFGISRALDLPPTLPTVISDIAYNLVEYPSAEISGDPVLVAVNYSQNPSLETNATNWDGTVASVSGSAPAAYQTDGRVTGELAAVGIASYRNRILGNGATTAAGVANLVTQHDVDLTTADGTSRPSFTVWAALVSLGGATGAALNSVTVQAQWRNGGGNVGAPVAIGSTTDPAEIAGKAWSLDSNDIPAGADRVRLLITANVNWSSSATPAQNSDIRLYADAAAVTVP